MIDPIAISEAYESLTLNGLTIPEDIAIVATDPDTWRKYIAWKIDAAQRFGRLAEVVCPHTSPESERDNDLTALRTVRSLVGKHIALMEDNEQPFMGMPLWESLLGDPLWDENAAQLVALCVHLTHLQEVAVARYLAFRASLAQA